MKIEKIDHLALRVKDVARMRQFYIKLLGTEDEAPQSDSDWIKCGDIALVLLSGRDAAEGDRETGFLDHLALSLDKKDYEKTKERLAEMGITDLYERDRKTSRSIYFSDPEGNELELCFR